MARKGSLGTWVKMLAVGVVCCIGGPALVYYVQPTDEELFKRYNPELQKKSLNRRYERQKEFDDFVTQLKTDSKDDRHSMRNPPNCPGNPIVSLCPFLPLPSLSHQENGALDDEGLAY
ncbi:hypothetical protein PG996_005660 [Apiospora saccharicola]|uniref:Cytochrome b mRNA-processing protein 4 n=1 Tax=Apiospora saccharicola TaxID=335842 RepID=A0ABR1VMD6_9PEZI